jgi:2-polyprenyl-6-methoxyphenol hydroxylase-like FAD-dependent oxidoreductase
LSAAPVDVLVVGAGPTGLMLANQLVRHGVRPLVVDRHAGPVRETRAIGVQARTLEIYERLGIVEQALALGRRADGVNLWIGGARAARLPFGDIGRGLSPFPYLFILGQDDNERLLGERLREQGVDVRWRCELVGLEPHDDRVVATLRGADGRDERVDARWVAGCDGARSAVRELNGIGFPGAPYEHVFFVADVQASGPMTAGELNVYLWRDGFHLFFPMRGERHWRVVGIVPQPLRGHDELSFDAVVPSVRDEVGGGLAFEHCTWFSTYRIHHRRAARFRNGRCFLLGDAAHIHSPVGAQGMNTGLQDAYNLAWKLALVVRGACDAVLLDSYAAEREPVAERLLRTTDRAFTFALSRSGAARFVRTRLLARIAAAALQRDGVRRFAFRTIAQTGIAYPDSALSQTLPGLPADAPRAGERFPWRPALWPRLDDRSFHLVLAGQPAPTLPRPLPVHAADELTGPAFWLLRPDGHVGLCGGRLDPGTLERYLRERVGFSAH